MKPAAPTQSQDGAIGARARIAPAIGIIRNAEEHPCTLPTKCLEAAWHSLEAAPKQHSGVDFWALLALPSEQEILSLWLVIVLTCIGCGLRISNNNQNAIISTLHPCQ